MNENGEYSIGVHFALLREWLDSWRQKQGYGGLVTHYWGNSLRYVGPAVTQHVGLINGYVRLFDATNDMKWLGEAKEVGRSILKLQNPEFYYSFNHSGLETNSLILSRVRSLLSNSWADSAILRLAKRLSDSDDQEFELFRRGAERNIKHFLQRVLWDTRHKKFLSNFEEFLGSTTPYFNPNKNCAALESLLLLSEINRDRSIIEDYCIPICEWILEKQIVTSNDSRQGAVLHEPLEKNRKNAYTFYNAVCLRGFHEMYVKTGERRWLSVAKGIAEFLLRNISSCGAFYSHYDELGRLHKYPYWIAPQSFILLSLLDLGEAYADKVGRSIDWMLRNQTVIGGFPTFYSFERTQQKPLFKDVALSTAWNSFVFELLSALLTYTDEEPSTPELKQKNYVVKYYDSLTGKPHLYIENPLGVNTIGTNHRLEYSADKKNSYAYMSPQLLFKSYTADLFKFVESLLYRTAKYAKVR